MLERIHAVAHSFHLLTLTDSRRAADHNVAREIQTSLETGILSNPNNKLSHRMSRTSTRQSTVARKARESRKAADISKELQLQIDAEVEKRRISNELTKSLKEQLNAAKGKSGKREKRTLFARGRPGNLISNPQRKH